MLGLSLDQWHFICQLWSISWQQNPCSMYHHVCMLSHIWLFMTPWTVAHQAPLSMGFSRQECWSGLPFPSPGSISLKIDLLKQISGRKVHVVSWNFLFNYVIILYVCICIHACVLCHNVSYISYHKLWPKSLRNTVLFNSKYFTNIQIFYFQDTNVKNVFSQLLAYFILWWQLFIQKRMFKSLLWI